MGDFSRHMSGPQSAQVSAILRPCLSARYQPGSEIPEGEV